MNQSTNIPLDLRPLRSETVLRLLRFLAATFGDMEGIPEHEAEGAAALGGFEIAFAAFSIRFGSIILATKKAERLSARC